MELKNFTVKDVFFEKIYFNVAFKPKDEDGTVHLGLTVGVMYEDDSEEQVSNAKVTFIYVGGNQEETSKRFESIDEKLFHLTLGQVVSFDPVNKGDSAIENELISLTYDNFKETAQSYFDLIGNSDIPIPDFAKASSELL